VPGLWCPCCWCFWLLLPCSVALVCSPIFSVTHDIANIPTVPCLAGVAASISKRGEGLCFFLQWRLAAAAIFARSASRKTLLQFTQAATYSSVSSTAKDTLKPRSVSCFFTPCHSRGMLQLILVTCIHEYHSSYLASGSSLILECHEACDNELKLRGSR
jgi:hypothetical protein